MGRLNRAFYAEPAPGAGLKTFAPAVRASRLFLRNTVIFSLMCCLGLLCCLAPGCGGTSKLVDMREEAVKQNENGYQYYRESKWGQAQAKFNEALKLNRLIDHPEGMAANLNNLGAIALEQGKLADAEKYYRDALRMAEEAGNGRGIGESLNNLGVVYTKLGRWNEADTLFQQALGYARSLPPHCSLLPLTLTHLGDVARHRKDYQQALNLYRQALDLDTAARNQEGQAVRWGRLGRTYMDMGDYASAKTIPRQGPGHVSRSAADQWHRQHPGRPGDPVPGPGRPYPGRTVRPAPGENLPGPEPAPGSATPGSPDADPGKMRRVWPAYLNDDLGKSRAPVDFP